MLVIVSTETTDTRSNGVVRKTVALAALANVELSEVEAADAVAASL